MNVPIFNPLSVQHTHAFSKKNPSQKRDLKDYFIFFLFKIKEMEKIEGKEKNCEERLIYDSLLGIAVTGHGWPIPAISLYCR